MTKLKIGLKIWSRNVELFNKVEELFNKGRIDYVEVYIVPEMFKETIGQLKILDAPIILHAPHSLHNFNPASKSLFESNMKIFEEIKKFASKLNFPNIIIHPEQGDLEQSLYCLAKFNYEGIRIENMPKAGLNKKECIGYNKKEIKLFLDKGFGFCLDLGHAIKAAYSLKEDPSNFVKELLEFKPAMFHLCDGHANIDMDEHLNLGEGNFDLKFLKKCITNSTSKMVTLETPRKNNFSLNEDIKNLDYFDNL